MNFDEPLRDLVMDSDYDKKDFVVIDNGSDTIKVGYSGEDFPRLILPSVIGVPKEKEDDMSSNKSPLIFGKDDRLRDLNEYTISYPIKNGTIDPADFEHLGNYWVDIIEGKLKLDLTQVNLMIIDSPVPEKQMRNQIAEKFFDEFKVSSISFMNSSTLSLFSTGRTRGIVLESGHGASYSVPIFEGFTLQHAIQHTNTAGRAIGSHLLKEINDRGTKFDKPPLEEADIVKYLKEKMCAVALDFDKAIKGADPLSEDDRSYEYLPDGNKIFTGKGDGNLKGEGNEPKSIVIQIDHKSRFTSTEILFKPALIGQSTMSLSEMMLDSFDRIDPDLKMVLLSYF
eukprot:TRINITY_DN13770_c0_g1_i1.p1 TRINITY_DN13770_c0_g1~~TRINITY_DN13770_c0_g1_i1.p1  ORF type:complete len:340 (+),score=98.00 TRINITY_DN13770_c0_g1_i1:50-1069(+)